VLMEGQFDVITAHQFGVGNAVASSGTALTDDQVRLLKRFTDELLLVFDSDRAGRAAMRKAAPMAAGHAMRTRVVTLPDSMDPDQFLRAAGAQAAERWAELAAKAPSSFEAGVEEDAAGFNPSNPIQVEAVARKIREWIRAFPAELRESYAETAERRTGISRHLLLNEPAAQQAEAPARGVWHARKQGPGKYLVQLLAVRPAAFERVQSQIAPGELDPGDRGIYLRMLESYERGGPAGLAADLPNYPQEEQDLIRRAWAEPPPTVDDRVAEELAKRIRLNYMKDMKSGIIRDLTEAERDGDSERADRIQTQLTKIGRAIADLEKEILTSLE